MSSTLLRKPRLPRNLAGLDLETKATELLAYILSTGIVNINMEKFQLTEVLSLELDPYDPKATELFVESESTIRWWEDVEEDHRWKPSPLAKNISWGGSIPHADGIAKTVNTLNELSRKGTLVTSRGPEFDYRILEQSAIAYNIDLRFSFSLLDSDRTYERISNAMGIEAASDEELAHYKLRNNIKHTAVADAGREAYNGARALWLAAIATISTPDEYAAAVQSFKDGTFDPKVYEGKVEFYDKL